jgi:hypothetical protein
MDSSPGHLPQTSFSQPGFGVIFPDSKSSREKAGSVGCPISSFPANSHLTSTSLYFAPFRLVFQVGELLSAVTDGHNTTSRHGVALADNQRPGFKIRSQTQNLRLNHLFTNKSFWPALGTNFFAS